MIDDYLGELELSNCSPQTIRAYKHDLARLFGRGDPTRTTGDQLKRRLAKIGTAPRTRQRAQAAARGFCRWMIVNGRRIDNPTDTLPKIKIPKDVPTVLFRDEFEALMEAIQSEGNLMHVALFRVLFGTGVRISECLSLPLDAFSNYVLTVRGKGNKERTIPISDEVRSAVSAYLSGGVVSEHSERLFPVSRQTVARLLVHYAAAAGITNKRVHPHVCRHTFATNYLRANPDDVMGLAMILGHALIATTQGYLHLITDDLTERINRM